MTLQKTDPKISRESFERLFNVTLMLHVNMLLFQHFKVGEKSNDFKDLELLNERKSAIMRDFTRFLKRDRRPEKHPDSPLTIDRLMQLIELDARLIRLEVDASALFPKLAAQELELQHQISLDLSSLSYSEVSSFWIAQL